MWNVIWQGRFSAQEKIINPELSECSHLDDKNIIAFQQEDELAIILELDEFEMKVILIIDTIVDEWISDYLHSKNQKVSELLENNRSFVDEVAQIWEEMYTKSQAICDTLEFIEEEEDLWLEFTEEFVFWAIESQLDIYKHEVFSLLCENDKKNKIEQ